MSGRSTRVSSALLLAATVGLGLLYAGCSSADPASSAEATPYLHGTYKLTSQEQAGEASAEPGTISEITFVYNRYSLVRNPCAAGPGGCGESGTFVLDVEHSTLLLTKAGSSSPTSMSVTLPRAELKPTSETIHFAGNGLVAGAQNVISGAAENLTPMQQALVKCTVQLSQRSGLAAAFGFGGGSYAGGSCPDLLSPEACASSCNAPRSCTQVKDPTSDKTYAYCLDPCNGTCGTQACLQSTDFSGSGGYGCGYDYCGGRCGTNSGKTCTQGLGRDFACCDSNAISCDNPDNSCKTSCADGSWCVKGTCVDSCSNRCKAPQKCWGASGCGL